MPRKTVEKTIDGTRYRCTQFGTLTAEELLLRALPMLSLTAIKRLDSDAIQGLLKAVTRDDLKWAIAQATSATQLLLVDEAGSVDPKTGRKRSNWIALEHVYDDHFAGRMLSTWPAWLGWVFEVNFADFLGGPGPSVTPAQGEAKASAESSSQSDASGITGESSPAPG